MTEITGRPEIIGKDFFPQGKAAYAAAHIALIDIRSALVANDMDDGSTAGQKKVVSLIRRTIDQISDHDDRGLFHPPLGYFSGVVKSEVEYLERDDAYMTTNDSGLRNLDRDKIQETSIMITAIVRHGLWDVDKTRILA